VVSGYSVCGQNELREDDDDDNDDDDDGGGGDDDDDDDDDEESIVSSGSSFYQSMHFFSFVRSHWHPYRNHMALCNPLPTMEPSTEIFVSYDQPVE
jgi:hypothetical protein